MIITVQWIENIEFLCYSVHVTWLGISMEQCRLPDNPLLPIIKLNAIAVSAAIKASTWIGPKTGV